MSKAKTWNAPARTLPLDLPPLDLLLRQHFPSRLELLCLCPVSPDAPKDPRTPSLPWRTTPAQPQTSLILHEAQPTLVLRAVFRRRSLLRGESTNDTPLYRIFLVSHELFMDCMRDEGLGFAREPEVETELVSELFRCEPRAQVPFDMIQ